MSGRTWRSTTQAGCGLRSIEGGNVQLPATGSPTVAEPIFEAMERALRLRHPTRKFDVPLEQVFSKVVRRMRFYRLPTLLDGAWAVAAYGYTRSTEDIDFLIPDTDTARRLLLFSMHDCEAKQVSTRPKTAKGPTGLRFEVAGWPFAFQQDPQFKPLDGRARAAQVGGEGVRVVAPKDLRKRKQARAAHHDLDDVKRIGSVE